MENIAVFDQNNKNVKLLNDLFEGFQQTLVLDKDSSIHIDDKHDSVYKVEEGFVKIVRYTFSGKRCVLGIHYSGSILCEFSLSNSNCCYYLETDTKTKLKRVSTERFIETLDSSELRHAYIRYMATLISEKNDKITSFITSSSEERLLFFLLKIAEKYGEFSEQQLTIRTKLLIQDLSDYVGTTRSRIGFFIKKLSNSGLLKHRSDGSISIKLPELYEYLKVNENIYPDFFEKVRHESIEI
ncbi:Crp/Fnr family transcriptional regulator [Endozoicomonas sp. G2_1]|uniref:Crp/Fnr family transcriptional regulator n=1 Tax=Endozoicomonas sp. G2_1 TaxID=2821091 RepID=UPI001ADD0286|nr:Crp/Fnr family transcriptional regulator [Endozoicomonas sp. G2_1]MBO9489806.1 Crp/Fnr family transcriptional regulator [Endozoicomonas sp. G2_1]